MNTPNKQRLYRCQIPVRPSLAHPKYWEVQSAYLLLFLYAESPEDAADKAVTIAEQLPYELPRSSAKISLQEKPPHQPELESTAECARQCGLGLFLVAMPPGSDDEGWLDDFCS